MNSPRTTGTKYDWVHPSWRDVAIEYLMSHPADRRQFLSTCGVEGVELALSRSGGAAGDRVLPLLENDADWDCLEARVLELVPGAPLRDHDRILRAIRGLDKLETAAVERRAALQHSVLQVIREDWNQHGYAIESEQLAAYFDVSLETLPLVAAPDLTKSITEYVEPLLEGGDQLHYTDCESAVALVAVIRANEPRALVVAEWPDRFLDPIDAILANAFECLARAEASLDPTDDRASSSGSSSATLPVPRSTLDGLSFETWGWKRVLTDLGRAGIDKAKPIRDNLAHAESAIDDLLAESEPDDDESIDDEFDEQESSDERLEMFDIALVLADL